MKLTQRVQNAVRAFTKPDADKVNNSTIGNEFLRYGMRPKMSLNIDDPVLSDEDMYTGYGFSVIERRANRSVTLGCEYTYTKAADAYLEKARAAGQDTVEHPYLKLINDSLDFTAEDFWYEYSRYMDLEGVFYILAIRTVTDSKMANGFNRVGNVQKFKFLNPYEVRRVFDLQGNLGGYVEQHDGMVRELPVEMVIPVLRANPVDRKKTFSLTDAASDAQFVLKQAADYSRKSIRNNINAPGLITSDIIMDDYEFENFKARVKAHTPGEPLFGNGPSAISYQDTSIDLNKSALTDVNNNNRDMLIAAAGVSKNQLGLDQAGTGRETSQTQKDDFTENAIMPQVKKLLGALNLDYKRYYPDEFKANKYEICLRNPLSSDYKAQQEELNLQTQRLQLSTALINAGYNEDLAYQFAMGEIDVATLGQPTEDTERDMEAYIEALRAAGASEDEILALTDGASNGDSDGNYVS